MSVYIKKFSGHTDYEAFAQTEDFIKPNVSLCIQEDDVHYNPIAQPLIIVYNVEDSQYTDKQIFYDGIQAPAIFDKIEVNGVDVSVSDIDSNHGLYDFGTVGNHTVAYTLHDPTTIPANCFNRCSPISVTLPSTVTTIGNNAFCRDIGPLDSNSINAISAINPSALRSCRMA